MEVIKFCQFFKGGFFPAELTLSYLSNKNNQNGKINFKQLNNLSNKNPLGGSGGMLSRKIFENLHTVMAMLVFFKQFLYFWPLIFSASPNKFMMHFVRKVSIMRA